ncbi:CAP domain-containing protein [Actinoplanes sp. DH11]|uniref:CAP domain-containing protein n=1 Tax=Actinoplanes sp. DH11 TaxID=2857011 RepID=UPI001E4D1012|nr:CAP domain-containing protein [Actinoplanes sp. DH11]
MRKPLVLACVAAATLAAGGVTATALAQASPDVPEVPDAQLFGVPMLPGDDADFAEPSTPAGPRPGAPMGDAVSAKPAPGESAGGKNHDKSDSTPTVVPSVSTAPGEPRRRGPKASGADGGAGSGADGGERAPAGRRSAGERAAPDVLAAARAQVTARDISNSPAAPVQQHVLALVNRNRRSHGCGNLTPDRRLIEAANRHAADMARRGYFAHEGPDGDRAGSRVSEAGYEWSRYGENIARGQKSPYEVVSDWMDSPQHRENILDCRLDQMGVGLAIAGDTPYWVQDFATPR